MSSPSPQDAPSQGPGLEMARVEHSIRIEAPLDEVWSSVADPVELAAWLGGRLELDRPLGPGAAGRLVELDGAVRHLLVTDHEPAQRLCWHWWRVPGDERERVGDRNDGFEGEGELSSVEITVTPDGDATVVRVVEVVALVGATAGSRPSFTGPDAVVLAERSWSGALAVLADRLGGLSRATTRW